MKRRLKNAAAALLGIICAASFAGGLSACKKHGPIVTTDDRTTIRKAAPTDGSLPAQHTAIENIGYMASVLDSQPSYHVYASNSTKALGVYEQNTQSWKDYKNASLSGIGESVMVCSDLSYSALAKSSSQSCFIGTTKAYMRTGNKPEKKSTPADINWKTTQPEYYDKDSYLYKYGEFSTELSVYVIDEKGLDSADEVVDNGDGTYSQKYYLNSSAGCWYQYGMKTRGGFKDYPVFNKIEITFTFDSKWLVLGSYCEEKSDITPSALGGSSMSSTSKTTTTFDYSESGFDNGNYSYFDNYYKRYIDTEPASTEPKGCGHELLDILAGGFGKVITAEGQQFSLNLTLGETEYEGKVYAKLPDLSDILGSLEVRLQLGKKESGRQDLYIEFKNGAVNAYYGEEFALTADIGKVSAAVGKFTEWVKSLDEASEAAAYAEEGGGSSLDLSSLLTALDCKCDETTAVISLATDNILGLGIGADVKINFSHTKGEEECTFAFKDLSLKDISYDGTGIDLSAYLSDDANSPVISRNPSDTPADLAEYMDGVYATLNCETLKVELGLNGLIEGLDLNATAFVKYRDEISTNVQITAEYKGISLTLDAYYVYDGGYGKVYLNLTEFNGNKYDAKVYCDVKDTVDAVKQLMGWAQGISVMSEDGGDAASDLAGIINKVLNLNFANIITGIYGNSSEIGLSLNADELLGALDVDLGMELGTVGLKLINGEDGKATLTANVEKLGLDVKVSGSDTKVVKPEGEYVDIVGYLNSVYALLNSETLKVELGLGGLIEGLTLNATAFVNYRDEIATNVNLNAKYEDITLTLDAYYVYDGGYGKIYLNLTEFNGNEYDAKVYCDIEKTVEAVKNIIALFNTESTATYAEGQNEVLANAIAYALSLNYNDIIKADNTSLKATVDVDGILDAFGADIGINFGEAVLVFDKNSSLTANVEEIGLDVKVSGSDKKVVKPEGEYIDILGYINSVYSVLNSETLKAKIKLDKLIEGLELTATAFVSYKEDIVADVQLKAKYEGVTLTLNAYYVYDGGYGKVYLNVTEFNGNTYDIKVYCDIKDTVEAVKKIIATFNGNANDTATYAEGQSEVLAQAIAYALTLNYNDIIKADNTSLKATVDVDGILGAFGVELGINFGEAVLVFDKNSNLTANVEEIGLEVTVSGSDKTTEEPKGPYVDINSYIDSIDALVNSESYEIKLKLNGNDEDVTLSYVEGITAEATVYVKPAKDFKSVEVRADEIKVSYNGIEAKLNAYYLYDGGYGKVYLNLTELNDSTYDIKVYCDIENAVESIQKLIATVKGKTTTTDENESSGKKPAKSIAEIIKAVLTIDYPSIIKQFNGTDTVIDATIDADEIIALFVKDFKVSFGEVSLTLNNGTAENPKATLSGSVPAIGLGLDIAGSGKDVEALKGPYVDVNSYIDSIDALVNSENYKIKLDLDGKKEGVSFSYIEDATVDATVYVKPAKNFKSVEVQADMTVTYDTFEAKLSAYYVYNGGYGKVFLNLTEFNGVAFDAKVYCDIKDTVEAVQQLIALINNSTSTLPEEGEKKSVKTTAEIITAVLTVDYPSIIKQFNGTNTAVTATVDADEIIALFVKDFKVSFGEVSLALNNGTAEAPAATLSGSIPALGLDIGIEGSANGVSAPDDKAYINVTELVELVKKATVEAQKIIDGKDIVFGIDAEVIADGVSMKVKGNGEVCWIDGKIRVAVDAVLTISEDGRKDSLDIKLVYDETAEEDEPLVRFAINSCGIEIYRSDVGGLVNDFNAIYDAVYNLVNGSSAQAASDSEQIENKTDKITVDDVLGLLNTKNAQTVIKTVLGFVSNLTVELQYTEGEEPDICGLLIEHAINGKLELTTNNNLAIAFEVNNNNGTKITGVTANVAVGKGDLIADINATLDGDGYTLCKSTETEKFVKVLYQYLFEVIDNKLSVGNILGSSTYTVKLKLNGADSAIAAIEKVSVDATLYYTEISGGKLAEAEVKLNIGETAVELNARYSGQNVYIELVNIAGTQLEGMKFKAGVNEIYSAVETVVAVLKSDNLSKIVSRFTPVKAQQISVLSGEGEETQLTVKEILTKILSLDFNKVIRLGKNAETGENVLTVNPDVVLVEFSIGVQIGTITASVNPETHKISASAKLEEKDAWLTLDAFADSENKHGSLNTDEYIDINFVSTLLKDAGKTLDGVIKPKYDVDGKKVGEQILLSLKGDIRVDLQYDLKILVTLHITTTITFKNTVLTVGYDENNNFYLSLTASFDDNKVEVAGLGTLKATTKGDISITYSGNYVTFGRDGNYKVMTLAYLLDNMLSSDNSPLQWLLGMDGTIWSVVSGQIPLNINSGLTAPEDVELFEQAKADSDKTFYLAGIINGFAIQADGRQYTYKTGNRAVSKLGVVDNYYAFDINGNSLTGGTIPLLYAALLRGDSGIEGLKAYASVAGYLDVYVNLTERSDTDVIDYGRSVSEEYNIDFNVKQESNNHKTPVFGMYDTASNAYSYSDVLDTVTLTVVTVEGEDRKEDSYEFRYGSVIHLSDTFSPDWADEGKRYIYIYQDAEGNVLGESIELKSDSTVYIYKVKDTVEKREVIYHTGVAGIDNVSAALDLNDGIVRLIEYGIDGYTLLGMYSNEACTLLVNIDSFDGSDVYCVYIKTTVTVNGVKYSVHIDDKGDATYHVSGYDESAILPYTEGATLILENEIQLNGATYQVTAIDEKAFANAMLKNVVVPENITHIASLAFYNNAGMRSVVFLAPEITFAGNVGSNENGGYAFYGCTENDGELTILSVYYNAVKDEKFTSNNEGIPDWAHVRTKDKNKYRYIGHNGGTLGSELSGKDRYEYSINDGNRVSSGNTWAYVNYEIISKNNDKAIEVGSVKFEQLVNISTAVKSKEEIVSYVKGVLNGLTSEHGYINAFEVEVSGGVELNRTMYTITITVTEKAQDKWYYLLTVESAVEGLTSGLTNVSGNSETVDGLTYVQTGAEVTVTSTGDETYNSFVGWTSSNENLVLTNTAVTTFAMPVGAVKVSSTWKAEYAENIYVYSEVAFTYNGAEYGTEGVELTNAAVGRPLADVKAVESSEYTFVGWAQISAGDVLSFVNVPSVQSQENITTYYAIWVINRNDGTTFTSVEGANLPTVNGGNIFAWYAKDDSTFTGDTVTSISVLNTVLRSRLQYSLTVNLEAKNTKWYYSVVNGDSYQNIDWTTSWIGTRNGVKDGEQFGSDNCTFDKALSIVEGYKVQVYRYWTGAIVIKVYDGNACLATYMIKGKMSSSYEWRGVMFDAEHYIKFDSGNWNIPNEVKPDNSDIYYRNGNTDTTNDQQLFGTVESANSNLLFTCKA